MFDVGALENTLSIYLGLVKITAFPILERPRGRWKSAACQKESADPGNISLEQEETVRRFC